MVDVIYRCKYCGKSYRDRPGEDGESDVLGLESATGCEQTHMAPHDMIIHRLVHEQDKNNVRDTHGPSPTVIFPTTIWMTAEVPGEREHMAEYNLHVVRRG